MRLSVFALGLIASAAPPKPAPDEVRRLLERVAEHYQRITEYDVEIELLNSARLFEIQAWNYLRVAASAPDRFHLSMFDEPQNLTPLSASNGLTAWLAWGQTKTYIGMPARNSAGVILKTRSASLFAERHIRHKERFDLVATLEQIPPRFVRYEDVQQAGEKCCVPSSGSLQRQTRRRNVGLRRYGSILRSCWWFAAAENSHRRQAIRYLRERRSATGGGRRKGPSTRRCSVSILRRVIPRWTSSRSGG